MKRILTFISVFALLFTACEGDPGPPGLDGPQGPPGQDAETAIPIAITRTFNDSNDFEIVEFFEDFGITPQANDVVLVYRFWENNAWRLLPQTVFFDNGNELDYNFDFTNTDFSIFLDSTVELNTLGSAWTDNQRFRIVLIPVDAINGVNTSDINAVMEAGNIENFQIR